jgi:hypothetical protein
MNVRLIYDSVTSLDSGRDQVELEHTPIIKGAVNTCLLRT